MRITICGQFWELEFTDIPGNYTGLCNPRTKTIKINNDLYGKRKLESVLLHCLYASEHSPCNHNLEDIARDVAYILWRLRGQIQERPIPDPFPSQT